MRHGSIGGLEYEVPQKLTHLLQCKHILHNFWTSTNRGKLPPSGRATVREGRTSISLGDNGSYASEWGFYPMICAKLLLNDFCLVNFETDKFHSILRVMLLLIDVHACGVIRSACQSQKAKVDPTKAALTNR